MGPVSEPSMGPTVGPAGMVILRRGETVGPAQGFAIAAS